MLINRSQRESLNGLFEILKLNNKQGKNKEAKIEQVLSYLEIIHANIRKYSKKRELVFVESCAGNCYLSFLVCYYYANIEKRNVAIHCVDINEKLMTKAQAAAKKLGFNNIYFHTGDVLQYKAPGRVDLVYSLHACDSATDGTLYLGVKNRASLILSVSCCQHSIKKSLRNPRYSGITKHGIFKDRIVYMVGDSLRALLIEMEGYSVDIFEFVSSRYTDKNIMMRARKGGVCDRESSHSEYEKIRDEFKVRPALEVYLNGV